MERRKPFLIGVAGGTASGKTTVCDKIISGIGQECSKQVAVIPGTAFYIPLTEQQIVEADQGLYNFDHPDAYDFKQMHDALMDLKEGRTIRVHDYDLMRHQILKEESKLVEPLDVVIVEGILLFYTSQIRQLFNLKLFVDIDPDTRLARRVLRDYNQLGRKLEQTLHQYISLVKPAFEEFCLPTKKYADIIIPHGGDNDKAIGVIVEHIKDILRTPAPSRAGTTDEDRRVDPMDAPHPPFLVGQPPPPPRRENSFRPH